MKSEYPTANKEHPMSSVRENENGGLFSLPFAPLALSPCSVGYSLFKVVT